jgi:hypothetical protein
MRHDPFEPGVGGLRFQYEGRDGRDRGQENAASRVAMPKLLQTMAEIKE